MGETVQATCQDYCAGHEIEWKHKCTWANKECSACAQCSEAAPQQAVKAAQQTEANETEYDRYGYLKTEAKDTNVDAQQQAALAKSDVWSSLSLVAKPNHMAESKAEPVAKQEKPELAAVKVEDKSAVKQDKKETKTEDKKQDQIAAKQDKKE